VIAAVVQRPGKVGIQRVARDLLVAGAIDAAAMITPQHAAGEL